MLLYSCFHDHAVEHVNVVVFSVAWVLRRSFSPVLCLQPKVDKIGVFAAIYIPTWVQEVLARPSLISQDLSFVPLVPYLRHA